MILKYQLVLLITILIVLYVHKAQSIFISKITDDSKRLNKETLYSKEKCMITNKGMRYLAHTYRTPIREQGDYILTFEVYKVTNFNSDEYASLLNTSNTYL